MAETLGSLQACNDSRSQTAGMYARTSERKCGNAMCAEFVSVRSQGNRGVQTPIVFLTWWTQNNSTINRSETFTCTYQRKSTRKVPFRNHAPQGSNSYEHVSALHEYDSLWKAGDGTTTIFLLKIQFWKHRQATLFIFSGQIRVSVDWESFQA